MGSPAGPERNARPGGEYRGVGARPAVGVFLVARALVNFGFRDELGVFIQQYSELVAAA